MADISCSHKMSFSIFLVSCTPSSSFSILLLSIPLLPFLSLLSSSFLPCKGELQADNAALKVRVSALEQEKSDEELRMQELMQQNAQLELQRERL